MNKSNMAPSRHFLFCLQIFSSTKIGVDYYFGQKYVYFSLPSEINTLAAATDFHDWRRRNITNSG